MKRVEVREMTLAVLVCCLKGESVAEKQEGARVTPLLVDVEGYKKAFRDVGES